MSYTESHYENAVLQLFREQLGYTHIYGPDIDRDYHSPLYEDVLLPSLQRVNWTSKIPSTTILPLPTSGR